MSDVQVVREALTEIVGPPHKAALAALDRIEATMVALAEEASEVWATHPMPTDVLASGTMRFNPDYVDPEEAANG